MFTVKLADMNIRIENKFEYIRNICRNYIVQDDNYDFFVSVTEEDIARESGETGLTVNYLESLAIYRKIAEWLPEKDGFLMHGVLLEVEGRGIMLCAKSGVGKSTHAALWMKHLGEKCRIINGDKPLLRIINNKIYAYGTPWCGKEGINLNARVELTDICFIDRNDVNITEKIADSEIIPRLFKQIYLPKADDLQKIKVLDLAGKVMKEINFWKIRCNMDISAAQTAYSELFKENK